MKFEPVIRLLTTFGVLIFSSCGEKGSPDEEANFEEQIEALESFKKRWVSLKINTLLGAYVASANNEEPNFQDINRHLRSLTQKLERLDTENLPYDLEAATERFRSDLIKLYEQAKKCPIPIELIGNNVAAAAWVTEQREKNPKFDQEFDKEMKTWEEEYETLEKDLFDEDEVGAVFAKYSININFSGLTGERFKSASAPESSPASVIVGVQPQIEQSVSDNAPHVSEREPLPKHDPAAKDEEDPTGIDKREEEGMALKLQVAELKGQLAEVEITIKNEQARWKSGLAVINKLTNYKKTPVKEGSRAYRQCLEASNMMKKIEAGAPKLKAQKSKLEAMIKSLEDE